MTIRIHPIRAFNDNYIWCIIDDEKKVCAVVDPGDAAPVSDYLTANQLRLTAILITHHHWDHTGGVAELLKKYPAITVYGPHTSTNTTYDHPLNENDIVTLPELEREFRVLEIPGHTLDHIAFIGHGWLFAGDTLFSGGCGRVFEGTYEQMYDALLKLAALPDETLLYCGHEYTELNLRFAASVEPDNKDINERIGIVRKLRESNTPTLPNTIANEKLTNPFLRCNNSKIKLTIEREVGVVTSELDVFVQLRKRKDAFNPDIA